MVEREIIAYVPDQSPPWSVLKVILLNFKYKVDCPGVVQRDLVVTSIENH